MKYTITSYLVFVFLIFSLPACKKYLDEKPNRRLALPSTLTDMQAILDYAPQLISDPGANEIAADDYYLKTADWLALATEEQRSIYTWEPDHIFEASYNDWATVYRKVYYANTVLDGLENIPVTAKNENEWKHVQGQALFIRAVAFLQAVDIWAPAFSTAGADAGIPLRMHADVNETSQRATVKDSYHEIIQELKSAILLLPAMPIHPYRPSQRAAYGYLARTFLAMGDYTHAALYADSALRIASTLIDYNTLNAGAAYPIARFNVETVFYRTTSVIQLAASKACIDSVLYNSYAANDCRKTIFFKNNGNGSFAFKGSYDGGDLKFSGMATDELYLVKAESLVRDGKISEGLAVLNALLIKRYKTGTFIPVTATTTTGAVSKVLTERRKELLMRFLRWMDIKRLNREGAGIVLKRLVDNKIYQLVPNDPRYAMAIPEDVIDISGMPQNPR